MGRDPHKKLGARAEEVDLGTNDKVSFPGNAEKRFSRVHGGALFVNAHVSHRLGGLRVHRLPNCSSWASEAKGSERLAGF